MSQSTFTLKMTWYTWDLEIEGGERMEKWECLACGYIYDPALGDPEASIPPGTPFEDLPDDWVCPECGVSKDMFQKME